MASQSSRWIVWVLAGVLTVAVLSGGGAFWLYRVLSAPAREQDKPYQEAQEAFSKRDYSMLSTS
jgi:hypothetical protein